MALKMTAADGSVSKLRLLAVCVPIVLLSEIATFEILMVFPALPKMAAHYATTGIAWVAAIVTLAGAITLPLAGKAADKYGKKKVILALATVFVVGSLICAMTDSFPLLLLGRALQGPLVGIVSIAYSLVRDIMPRHLVPVILGTVVTGIGMGAVAGPFIAGWLIDVFGFRGVFWFLTAYVGVLIPVFLAVVPESPARVRVSIDYLGALLLGPSLGLLLIGLGGLAKGASAGTLGMLALGVLLLIAFVFRESRAKSPLIDLRVLCGKPFLLTVLSVGLVSYMMNAHAILSPTMFQTPRLPGNTYGAGLSALQLAAWTFPLGIVAMFVGPLGGYLAKKIGARQVLLLSAILFLLVMFLGSRLFTLQWQVAITSITAGFAIGFLHSSNANLLQDALPLKVSGVGNSLAGVVTLLAGSAGSSITGSVMAQHIRAVDPKTHAIIYTDSAFTSAYLVAGIIGVVGVVVVATMKHGRKPAQGGLYPEVSETETSTAPVTPGEAGIAGA